MKNLETFLGNWFVRDFFVCKYYGNINSIEIIPKNTCESILIMNLERKNWDYPRNILYNEKLKISQSLYSVKEDCSSQNEYLNYNSENLPIYGEKNIYEVGKDDFGVTQTGSILNTDLGIKYRFTTEVIANKNLAGWMESENIPVCRGGIIKEYPVLLLTLFFGILIIGIFVGKKIRKT